MFNFGRGPKPGKDKIKEVIKETIKHMNGEDLGNLIKEIAKSAYGLGKRFFEIGDAILGEITGSTARENAEIAVR